MRQNKFKAPKVSLKEFETLYNNAVLHAVRISVREYMRNNVKYNISGKPFTLMNRNKELGTFVPKLEEKKAKYTMKDLMTLRFKGGKNLSQEVDKIVYGI